MENLTELETKDIYESEGTDFSLELYLKRLESICYSSENLTEVSQSTDNNLYCPKVFDSWACWNETLAGETSTAQCPFFISGFDSNRVAHKLCTEDGTWFKHPESNLTWSNYTNCVNLEELESYQTVNKIYEVGYIISILALTVSLIIFSVFRSLDCTRVRIHKHLFASFIINNTLWVTWYAVVVNSETTVIHQNQIWCISLHILVQYFLVANYCWMFCEGFYLHMLVVYVFTRASESNLLKKFYVFGWLGPFVPISLYVAFRVMESDEYEHLSCWIQDSQWRLFIAIPVCISLFISLGLLINILRTLVAFNANRNSMAMTNSRESQVNSSSTDADNTLTKVTRATLILIPLLGLNFLLTPFRPDPDSKWTLWYDYMSAFSSSFQGLAVSLLFCFCNDKVRSALKMKIDNVSESLWSYRSRNSRDGHTN